MVAIPVAVDPFLMIPDVGIVPADSRSIHVGIWIIDGIRTRASDVRAEPPHAQERIATEARGHTRAPKAGGTVGKPNPARPGKPNSRKPRKPQPALIPGTSSPWKACTKEPN